MNKILVDNNIISNIDGVSIDGNTITFLNPGDYEIEYVSSGKYELIFKVNDNINLVESSFDNELEINNNYIISKGNLKVVKFYNNKDVIEKINIDLRNDGSRVDYQFSNICREDEYYEININHESKNTISNIVNKSISLKNSKLKFVINSNVYKECNGSVLDQNTRIVTMGECDASISPNMFIDLDDVEAKHGSVIGTFKEEQIFYLMSKGICYNDTLKLLIKGYLFSNLDVNNDLKTKINDIINTYWR